MPGSDTPCREERCGAARIDACGASDAERIGACRIAAFRSLRSDEQNRRAVRCVEMPAVEMRRGARKSRAARRDALPAARCHSARSGTKRGVACGAKKRVVSPSGAKRLEACRAARRFAFNSEATRRDGKGIRQHRAIPRRRGPFPCRPSYGCLADPRPRRSGNRRG